MFLEKYSYITNHNVYKIIQNTHKKTIVLLFSLARVDVFLALLLTQRSTGVLHQMVNIYAHIKISFTLARVHIFLTLLT